MKWIITEGAVEEILSSRTTRKTMKEIYGLDRHISSVQVIEKQNGPAMKSQKPKSPPDRIVGRCRYRPDEPGLIDDH